MDNASITPTNSYARDVGGNCKRHTMQHMIKNIIGLILTAILISNCSIKTQSLSDNDSTKTLSKIDTVWINFKDALLNNRFDYLIANSCDTIQCIDCLSDSLKSENEIYDSKIIYTNHLKSLVHKEIWDKHNYTISETDSLIYINYSLKSKYSEEGGENLVYIFKNKNEQFLFNGMITIP